MIAAPMDAADWRQLARGLADQLVERGDLHGPAWYEAVAGVARHVLVPGAYEQDASGAWQPVDVTSAAGLERVYSPVTLVTALADYGGGGSQIAVSSSTKPDLVVRMLEALDVHDGHRVLDIGTGSGYQTALLTHRLDEDHVFSVDVDPELVCAAKARLRAIGMHPTVVTADGAGGLAEHAPYDRIIVTCSVPRVPWEWAEQLAPGGKVLVDVKTGTSAGNLVLLTRHSDRLQGRFTSRFGSFMTMRHAPGAQHPETHAPRAPQSGQRTTTLNPTPWWDNRVVWFLAHLTGLSAGTIHGMELDPETRQSTASLITAPDGSWATVSLAADHSGQHTVREGGPTALWAHTEGAHRAWEDHGTPDWSRLGLTVTPQEQRVWIDEPTSESSWPLRA